MLKEKSINLSKLHGFKEKIRFSIRKIDDVLSSSEGIGAPANQNEP